MWGGREELEKSETNVTWEKQSFIFIIWKTVELLFGMHGKVNQQHSPIYCCQKFIVLFSI